MNHAEPGLTSEKNLAADLNRLRKENSELRAALSVSRLKESKLTESRMILERSQLETIFQESPAAMALWAGPNFIFEKVNPHYQAIFPDRILQGRPFLEACPEFKDQPFFDLLTHVLETGEPFVGKEVLARHADYVGGPLVDHYYDFTYMRVSDANGKPYGVYDHATDVTDKVIVRKELEKNEARLQKLAEGLRAAVVARDIFLGIASHELKTPLTTLKLQAQITERLLAREGISAMNEEKTRKLVSTILTQANRLNALVDDMLDVSKIHAGKLKLNCEKIDLCNLIHEILDRFQVQFDIQGCELSKNIHGSIEVYADASRIEQVLVNLITNAIKYAPRKPIEIVVSLAGKNARVSLRDQGAGIAPEDQSRIFGRFERANPTSMVGGLGLGLYICKKIIEEHQGNMFVESELGQGSTFSFEIPLHVTQT